MITITKETIESFGDACKEGIAEAEVVWKDKEPTFPIAVKDLPTSLENKLYLLFKLGVRGFDILLYLSPYSNKKEFDAAHELPENRNLYSSPHYFAIYRITEKTGCANLAIDVFGKYLSEEMLDDFLTNNTV